MSNSLWTGTSPTKFILFGDSLTQLSFGNGDGPGWGSLLSSRYVRRADVINRGFSGYNTKWALQLLSCTDDSCFSKSPALVTIFLGANDAQLPEVGNVQHISLENYEAGLRDIISFFEKLGTKHIVLITPPSLNEDDWLERLRERQGNDTVLKSDRRNTVTEKYAKKCKEVAADLNLDCVDLWKILDCSSEHFSDGLHFSPLGHKLVFEELAKVIDEKMPDLVVRTSDDNINSSSVSELLPLGPWWDHIGNTEAPFGNKKQRTK